MRKNITAPRRHVRQHAFTPLDELSRLGEVRDGEETQCLPFQIDEPFPLSELDFCSERFAKRDAELRDP